ncbi:uncharacterized protein [Littorina saxatilis]|uniref:uncharacterized protein n=1 Tax=Littorina saxatilis TaxID=31220 RepID=UPI0038B67C8F
MWKEVATAFALGLLVPPRPSAAQSGCLDDAAPDNCNFTCGDTCNWINETGWVSRNSSGWFLALKEQQQTGRLTSRKACSTGGADYCLTFWYRFTRNFIIDLDVLIGENINTAVKVWNTDHHSISGQWEQAKVSFNTTTEFVVVISSQRYRDDYAEDSVFVDSVKYFKSSCDSTPTVATLPTDPTDSLPCVDPTTTTDNTNPDQTASNSSAGSGQTTVSGDVTKSSVSQGVLPGASSESSASGATESSTDDDDGGSSVNGGVIAGIVIAVILIIVIAIGAVIFAFRKQLRS